MTFRTFVCVMALSSICACTTGEPTPMRDEPSPPGKRAVSPPVVAPPVVTPTEPPAVTGRRDFEAGTLPDAVELAASYVIDHLHQDLNYYTTRRYDMNVRLAVEADGHASLSLAGKVAISSTELDPSGASTSSPRTEHEVDETWSGAARMLDGELVVRFDSSTAYRPPLAVDVEWICEATTLSVGERGKDVSGWQCATSQVATQPSGAAHDLVVYMQMPIVLAPPRERLHVEVHADGGADNRSTIASVTYSRAP